MPSRHDHALHALHVTTVFLAATAVFALVVAIETNADAAQNPIVAKVPTVAVSKGAQRSTTPQGRLYNRLHAAGQTDASPANIERAMEERRTIMQSTVRVRVADHEGSVVADAAYPMATYGSLVTMDVASGKAVVSVEQVKLLLVTLTQPYISPPVHCAATSILPEQHDAKGKRTRYERLDSGGCVVRDGMTFDIAEAAARFISLAQSGGGDMTINLTFVRGEFHNMTGRNLGELTLISSGKTNFQGSTWAREQNIKKALHDHLNGVIIPAGETFSFNSNLGGPVSQSRGWHMALGIFGGSELRPTPGGGICQTSTTTFRAALYAGLPIIEQANHSLFVTYYEKYGVGQDATIFPGSRDLRFVNDTGHPIVIQAYIVGKDAYVDFLGTPDGRHVTLEGPYFSGENPDYVIVNNRPVRNNEIAWVRRVESASGGESVEIFASRYKNAIGNWVRKNWTREDIAAEEVRVNF